MVKKVSLKIDNWDYKSFLLTIILLLIGIILIYFFSDISDKIRKTKEEQYSGKTNAQIVSINPIQEIKQTKFKGTQIFIGSYKVTYNYTISGNIFSKYEFIPVSTENNKFLKRILERNKFDIFKVKFDTSNFKKSILVDY